ncbi:hypothetical protein D3C75_720890 [compost metagenome]
MAAARSVAPLDLASREAVLGVRLVGELRVVTSTPSSSSSPVMYLLKEFSNTMFSARKPVAAPVTNTVAPHLKLPGLPFRYLSKARSSLYSPSGPAL